MLVNMLRAISDMLKGDDAATEVKCARIMLDEIIKGLDAGHTEAPPYKVCPTSGQVVSPRPEKPREPKATSKPGAQIIVDTQRRITKIEGLQDDDKVELDNKIMTVKEAIGKTFTSGRIL